MLEDEMLTIDDLATYLKLKPQTIYKWAQSGRLPGAKFGKEWRFRRSAIERWIDEHMAMSNEAVEAMSNEAVSKEVMGNSGNNVRKVEAPRRVEAGGKYEAAGKLGGNRGNSEASELSELAAEERPHLKKAPRARKDGMGPVGN